jgi:hypothetical protein
VKGTFHGPDGLSRRPRQPNDTPSEDEDFDFEDWVDHLHGLLHVIQPLRAEGAKSILSGQIEEIAKGSEISNELEISRESEISYDEVPRSEKVEKEDERLRMVEIWHRNLERPEGLSDTEYAAFVRYTMGFSLGEKKLWRKNAQGVHQLVIPKEHCLHILREVHDRIGHKRFYPTREIITQ